MLAVFWIVSMVEALCLSQVFAFLPRYLSGMHVSDKERLAFIGVFNSLTFVVGAPLVPLWGVWADKYSRKTVILRSAVVEAIVLAAIARSRTPWQLAASLMLTGLQLGNSGVMLAAIRDVTPAPLLGRAMGIFGASGAVGFALGPVLAGLMVDDLGFALSSVYAVAATLSAAMALLVGFATREVRPACVPEGPVLKLAWAAVRGVLSDAATLRIFAAFGVSFLANQIARPYLPVLVEGVTTQPARVASAIGLVTGTAALAGAIVSPLAGWIGDRVGFRSVLAASLVGSAFSLAVMPWAPSVLGLAAVALIFAALNAAVTAMVFGLVATTVPVERRSASLNLVYLPLYASGLIGPSAGAAVVSLGGLRAPFVAGALVFLAGGLAIARRHNVSAS